MNDHSQDSADSRSVSCDDRVDMVCDEFELALREGEQPQMEKLLGDLAEPQRSALLSELLAVELAFRRQAGETPSLTEYSKRFPEHYELLQELFAVPNGRSTVVPKWAADSTGVSITYVRANPDQASWEKLPRRFGDYELLEEIARGVERHSQEFVQFT